MMLVRFGKGHYGATHSFAGSAVVTEFFHLWRMPFVPLRSMLVDLTGARLETELNGRSIAAAYATTWAPIGAMLFGVTALRQLDSSSSSWPAAVICVVLLGVTFWGTRASRIGRDEEARRLVYAAVTRQPFDVAALPLYNADEARSALRPAVIERTRGLLAGAYREALDPERDWARVAIENPDAGADFLREALTLARLESGIFTGAERARRRREHDRIWQRLSERIAVANRPSS